VKINLVRIEIFKWCCGGFNFPGILHRVDRQIVTDVSEELAVSIFRT